MSSPTTPPSSPSADQAASQGSTEQLRKPIVNRLKRAHGQLASVIAAVESGADCRDVITQLSAVSKAVDRAGFMIISGALQECLESPEGEETHTVEELEKLFMSLA